MELTLDPNVFVIVSLRRRGHSEDEISAMKAIIDSVDKETQVKLAEMVALEDEEIIRTLVKKLPAIRDAVIKGGDKTAAQIIEEAAEGFKE